MESDFWWNWFSRPGTIKPKVREVEGGMLLITHFVGCAYFLKRSIFVSIPNRGK
jgi:hypothetical protein